ncbi:hypothetical protein OsJ_07131 [Oryza sativa Japonica Group]|uniref:Hexosyltransferase n=1 Tax=Oryza sativa subsp. japonica TaxID=39947 RepID=B9F0J6_ORYSJ|nr:hypothetical protein OsJ_07131 [Oryza sativa Japonica Group]
MVKTNRFINSLSKRGYIGSYHYEKDAKYRPFSALLPEGSNPKMLYVKLVLIILMCGSFVSLLNSPSIHHNDDHHTESSAGVPRVSYEPDDTRYVSDVTVDWPKISKAMQLVAGAEHGGGARVALLNFDDGEVQQWRTALPQTAAAVARLERAGSNVTWEHLYPEWIDEEELYHAPTCPDLPEPAVDADGDGEEVAVFDVVAVKLPCRRGGGWSKDVARLHLQLAAARLAATRGRGGAAAHVLVVSASRCFPIPNLFRCRDEVAPRDGDVWLYRPDADALRRDLALPVGSCRLAMPFSALAAPHVAAASAPPPRREAYATILHSEELYACGALVAAQSIRMASASGAPSEPERDMVALVDETISARHRGALEAAVVEVRTRRLPRRRPAGGRAPMLPLFAMPEVSATANHGTLFNSGVMVVEACGCRLRLLMDHIADIDSYNGGDQGYLNEVFSWRAVLAAEPAVALAVHFVGMKPWFCFRDYDCNWNSPQLRQFASDEAHARWWRAHDAMPAALQGFCLLDERQKALLRWDAAEARAANFSDGHWRVPIADPRRNICATAAGDGEAAAACVEREIENRRVEGNRVTTSYAKLIDNF